MASAMPGTAVEIEHLFKRYRSRRGEVHALENVSFNVGTHEFVSLVGPSGCGKSTLLKMLAGVTPVSRGQIRLNGREIQGPVDGLGMVFQTPLLLEWRDVLNNVLLPIEILGWERRHGEQKARHLIELVGLSGFEHAYPHELSGGMQQRVSICRALVFDPSLLLMDEPFGALDALTRDDMAVELLRIHAETKKTVLFVTHSIDEAVFLSDRVIVLTPRPGSIQIVLEVDLPRPRALDVRFDPKFIEYSRHIREAIYATRRGAAENAAG
jgi:NitT/TauT family transport system ATP-binding protein